MVNLPFVFGIGFFLRVFVPGIVAGFVVVMLQGQLSLWFGGVERVTLFLLLSGALGMVLRVVLPFAGEVLMGHYWPGGLRRLKIASLEKSLRRAEGVLKDRANEFSSEEGWRYVKAMRYVVCFPMDASGRRRVVAPTLVGNIVAASFWRLWLQHGLPLRDVMDWERHMGFVLTRLWYSLPVEVRREVSDGLAEFEALVGSGSALVLGGASFLAKGVVLALKISWALAVPAFVLAAGAGALAWLVYWALVKKAVAVGTVYEALFGQVSASQLEGIIEEARARLARMEEGYKELRDD